jgi:hypothetical protein
VSTLIVCEHGSLFVKLVHHFSLESTHHFAHRLSSLLYRIATKTITILRQNCIRRAETQRRNCCAFSFSL